mmetsp:Transcript_5129/g.19018  ORF Transcript_5129/g.19018 Transcript_5129/m.19018 type:complete len:354 (-) Transcript_5129:1999-3060(-)
MLRTDALHLPPLQRRADSPPALVRVPGSPPGPLAEARPGKGWRPAGQARRSRDALRGDPTQPPLLPHVHLLSPERRQAGLLHSLPGLLRARCRAQQRDGPVLLQLPSARRHPAQRAAQVRHQERDAERKVHPAHRRPRTRHRLHLLHLRIPLLPRQVRRQRGVRMRVDIPVPRDSGQLRPPVRWRNWRHPGAPALDRCRHSSACLLRLDLLLRCDCSAAEHHLRYHHRHIRRAASTEQGNRVRHQEQVLHLRHGQVHVRPARRGLRATHRERPQHVALPVLHHVPKDQGDDRVYGPRAVRARDAQGQGPLLHPQPAGAVSERQGGGGGAEESREGEKDSGKEERERGVSHILG